MILSFTTYKNLRIQVIYNSYEVFTHDQLCMAEPEGPPIEKKETEKENPEQESKESNKRKNSSKATATGKEKRSR